VLPLLLSHAGSCQEQLSLAAQLLPLSSNMRQLLGGSASGGMQLRVTAHTWPRARQVSAWLRKYGPLVASLELDAVVCCCELDASKASTAVMDAVSTTAAGGQQVRQGWVRRQLLHSRAGSVCMHHACTCMHAQYLFFLGTEPGDLDAKTTCCAVPAVCLLS
jgi:hypothetical protein